MTPDQINAFFEFGGSVMTWKSVYRVYQDKGYAGIDPLTLVFFVSWGAWNLFYYPHLEQWWSFWGGVSITTANVFWIGLMTYYGRKR